MSSNKFCPKILGGMEHDFMVIVALDPFTGTRIIEEVCKVCGHIYTKKEKK